MGVLLKEQNPRGWESPTWMGGSLRETVSHVDGNGILGVPTSASGALSPMSRGGGVGTGHVTH
jgi:hypothetical protein